MAYIDYGCIVFKNGKIINRSTYFNDMKEMVGWEDTEPSPIYDGYTKTEYTFKMSGNCFAYIGDKDFTIGFYKTSMYVYDGYNSYPGHSFIEYHSPFDTNYTWSKYKILNYKTGVSGKPFEIKVVVTKRHGYLVCKMKYKGDKYKVYFGCGVDLDYYKKYHIVNMYGTPWFKIKWFFTYDLKDIIDDIRWKIERWGVKE